MPIYGGEQCSTPTQSAFFPVEADDPCPVIPICCISLIPLPRTACQHDNTQKDNQSSPAIMRYAGECINLFGMEHPSQLTHFTASLGHCRIRRL